MVADGKCVSPPFKLAAFHSHWSLSVTFYCRCRLEGRKAEFSGWTLDGHGDRGLVDHETPVPAAAFPGDRVQGIDPKDAELRERQQPG